jgi:hypothetical protein
MVKVKPNKNRISPNANMAESNMNNIPKNSKVIPYPQRTKNNHGREREKDENADANQHQHDDTCCFPKDHQLHGFLFFVVVRTRASNPVPILALSLIMMNDYNLYSWY